MYCKLVYVLLQQVVATINSHTCMMVMCIPSYMYIYIYVHIFIYVHIYIYAHMHKHTHTYSFNADQERKFKGLQRLVAEFVVEKNEEISALKQVCICTCVYVYMHIHMYKGTSVICTILFQSLLESCILY